MDYQVKEGKIICAGSSQNIYLLDEETKKIVRTYEKGDFYTKGHTNRIFKLKFDPQNPQTFLSGGWDCTLF